MDLYTELSSDPEFDYLQSEEIKHGLKDGLDVKIYAKPQYSSYLMRQLRKGLETGIDLTPYVGYDIGILHQIRKAYLAGVDITPYVEAGYTSDQLDSIRMALSKNIPIDKYLNTAYPGTCIREIATGLMQGLDVSLYADIKYSWRKMREIRLGLYHRIDAAQYSNPRYSCWQMKELRLGLESGLDISCYKSLMYTANIMKIKRLELEYASMANTACSEIWRTTDLPSYKIHVSRDEMNAFMEITDENWKPDASEIRFLLSESGIKYGINDVGIAEIVSHVNVTGRLINVANGTPAKNGTDGYYLWDFESRQETLPRQLSNGSADFQNIRLFERVSAGQTLATYCYATQGTMGTSVLGNTIYARRGKELPCLTGSGFVLLDDKRTYASLCDGHVRLHHLCMTVEKLLVLDELNTEERIIDYDGSIYIRGDVSEGFTISATGDIVVDGCVSDSTLNASRNILIRRGINMGGGNGYVEAGQNVIGGYFELANVTAGKNIYCSSCLNSTLNASGSIITFGKRGGIIGGIAYAEKGFCISNAGNSYGRHTKLCLGLGHDIKKLHDRYAEKKLSIESEINKLEDSFMKLKKTLSPFNASMPDLYTRIENALYTKKVEYNEVIIRQDSLKKRIERALQSQIIIDGNLYDNVTVSMNNNDFKPGNLSHSAIKLRHNDFYIEHLKIGDTL